ncbi:MAG: fosfomycin resistance glutathione transferase [Pseudomonadota bacterium]
MITGFNHLTLGVSDLEQSIGFYESILGLTLKAKWKNGAYLLAGDLWLCLSLDTSAPAADYTHYAFTIDGESLGHWQQKLAQAGVRQWKENRSEGNSIYILDPDGHQLELHVGDIHSRLESIKLKPYQQQQLFD